MTDTALQERYRGFVCDLDGVVYRGPAAVPHAVAALNNLPAAVVYATNNASRTPQEVADHLVGLGLHTGPQWVVNSSMAAADVLACELAAGATVLAIGGPGVAAALTGAGLHSVFDSDQPVAAVLQGYGTTVTAGDLAQAAYAIQRGARWVATNDDLTLPTDRGIAPGNGALVAAVAAAAGARPRVTGKPHPPLYLMSARVLDQPLERVLAIGDRLETDIAGAVTAGMDSALVLTGVHRATDAALAPPEQRPRYVLGDLRDLALPYAEPLPTDDGFRCAGTRIRVDGAQLRVDASPESPPIEAVRAGIAAIWAAADHGAGEDRLRALASQLPGAS